MYKVTAGATFKEFTEGLKKLPHVLEKSDKEQVSYDVGERFKEIAGNAVSDRLDAMYMNAGWHLEAGNAEGPMMGVMQGTLNAADFPYFTAIKKYCDTCRETVERKMTDATPVEKADLSSWLANIDHHARSQISAVRDHLAQIGTRVPPGEMRNNIRRFSQETDAVIASIPAPDMGKNLEIARVYEENNLPYPAMVRKMTVYQHTIEKLAEGKSADVNGDVEKLNALKTECRELMGKAYKIGESKAMGFQQNFAGITKGEPLGTVSQSECVGLFFTAADGTTLGVHVSPFADMANVAQLVRTLPSGPLDVAVIGAVDYEHDGSARTALDKVHKFFTSNADIAQRSNFVKADIELTEPLRYYTYDPKTKSARFEYPVVANDRAMAPLNLLGNETKNTPIRLSFDLRKSERVFPVKMPAPVIREAVDYDKKSPAEQIAWSYTHCSHGNFSNDLTLSLTSMDMQDSLAAIADERKRVMAGLSDWFEKYPTRMSEKLSKPITGFRPDFISKVQGAVDKATASMQIYFGDNAEVANRPVAELFSNPKTWVANNAWVQIDRGVPTRATPENFQPHKLSEQIVRSLPASGMEAVVNDDKVQKHGIGSKPTPFSAADDDRK